MRERAELEEASLARDMVVGDEQAQDPCRLQKAQEVKCEKCIALSLANTGPNKMVEIIPVQGES